VNSCLEVSEDVDLFEIEIVYAKVKEKVHDPWVLLLLLGPRRDYEATKVSSKDSCYC